MADEEPEPQLKYELLGGDVKDILSKERITCMTLSEKIVALGTEQGRVHVLDYSGNQVRLLNLHKSRVNDLSFDKEAEHIASASHDCSVVVTNLYTEQVTRHEFKSPVKVVGLDPRPPASSRRTWRDLVTGTAAGEVTLHTQGWLGRSDQPLAAASSRDAAAGGVLALKWSGPLVAWAFDSAVSVYDTGSQQLIRTLRRYDPRADPTASHTPGASPVTAAGAKRTAPAAAPSASPSKGPAAASASASAAGGAAAAGIAGLRRCSLLFAPDSHLYVAWSDIILVARIGSYENNMGWLSPQVELVARMRLGEAVLGVSPYGDNDLAVLVYPTGAPSLSQKQQQIQPQSQSQPQTQQLSATPGAASAAAAADAEGSSESGPASVVPPAASDASVDRRPAGTAPTPAEEDAGPAKPGDGSAAASESAADSGPPDADRPPPAPPPDPLAPGRTPQLVILGRSDHREWARDAVPLPAAERCGPADYLGLLPSLPHHLHLPSAPSTAATTAARAGAGAGAGHKPAAKAAPTAPPAEPAAATSSAASSESGAAAAANAAKGPATKSDAAGRGQGNDGQGGEVSAAGTGAESAGAPGGAAPSAGSTEAGAARAIGADAGASGGPEAPSSPARRLVPVWVDGQELMFFIAAPMAIATARSRDASDRLTWLLARRRWEEALSVVEEAPQGSLPPGTYDRVVDGYIEELLTRQAYDRAVELSERLLRGDAERWARLVYLFAQVRQLPKLVGRLPTDKPRLRAQVYDVALHSLLPNPADHPTLVSLAQRWPPGCYSMAGLADAVAGVLRRIQAAEQQHQQQQHKGQGQAGGQGSKGQGVEEENGTALWELLAWLYEQQGRPDLALSIYLRLRSPAVFSFVTQHGLQANLLGRAPDLLQVDERAALALLTAHAEALPPSNVVPSIQEAMRTAPTPAEAEVWRRRLFSYLQGLFAVDSSVGADYQDLQVSLTAEYQPSKLMDLLVSSQYYSLEAALAICEARGLVPEQVFVLGRMGNADQALRLIIDRLGDIPRAIDFVVGQRDDELWGRLIDWALHSPETTGALLDCIGGYVDPLLLVRRIPRGMRVERLRDRLRAIIADYRTQTSLREGCNAILRSDCRHLLAKLYDGTRRALPYAYVHRAGTGGEPGQWYRCDVVHGGRLQSVTPSEVPWEVTSNHLGLAPGADAPPPTTSGRHHSGGVRPPPAPASGGGGLTRNHGSSAPALDRAAAAAAAPGPPPQKQPQHHHSQHVLGHGRSGKGPAGLGPGRTQGAGTDAGAEAASVTEGLPWWARQDGAEGPHHDLSQHHHHQGSSASLWVGFNLAAARARLGGEDGLSGPSSGAASGPASRRAAPGGGAQGRGGSLATRSAGSISLGPGQAGGAGGSGSSQRVVLGSLWQHVVTQA